MVGGTFYRRLRARPGTAAAAVVLFVGLSGGVAYATTHDDPGAFRQAIITDAAKRLGVSPSALTNALQQAAIDQINQAVTAGKLTRAQGNEIIQNIKAGHGPGMLGSAGGPPGGGFFHHRGGFGGAPGGFAGPGGPGGFLSGAATYLGMSNADLFNDLRSGKTLADVAKSKNKSVSGLEQAMLNASKARLNDAVKHGFFTQQREQQVLAGMKTQIDDFVTNGFRFHRGGFGGGNDHGSNVPSSAPALFGSGA